MLIVLVNGKSKNRDSFASKNVKTATHCKKIFKTATHCKIIQKRDSLQEFTKPRLFANKKRTAAQLQNATPLQKIERNATQLQIWFGVAGFIVTCW